MYHVGAIHVCEKFVRRLSHHYAEIRNQAAIFAFEEGFTLFDRNRKFDRKK